MKKLSFILLSLVVVACSGTKKPDVGEGDESTRFNRYLDQTFDKYLKMSPQGLADFGIKERYNELDNYTEDFQNQMHEMEKQDLKELKTFDRSAMNSQAQLSYDLALKAAEDSLQDHQWRHHRYRVNQQGGIHTSLPVFMINTHKVDNEKDLTDYIARLKEFKRVFSETIVRLKVSEAQGVVPPRFVFPYVIEASQKVIRGRPFQKGQEESPLLADFKAKAKKLKLDGNSGKKTKEGELVKQAEEALVQYVKPAYEDLITFMKEQEKRATTDDGAWKLPRGAEFYQNNLKRITTTNMTADQIHEMGLKNVERLRNDMIAVKNKLGFKGDLAAFFKSVRKDPKQYYPNTPKGKQEYLNQAKAFQASISKKVPEFFSRIPQTPMEVRAVEKFREASAGKAFYDGPSDDGSRPGIYYVNLQDTKNAPKFENEALFYHEGIPGHHFQIALSIELKELPKLRRYTHYTSFIEGWGLYAERLGKDMGGYKDLYSELGRLSMEMIRACRLVVDTGIHHKKWTRQQGIDFFAENLPVSQGMQVEQVERFIIWPGQATAYMVGMLKIYELRERAQAELQQKFDFRDFHKVVLENGAVPLDILERHVNEYIAQKKAG